MPSIEQFMAIKPNAFAMRYSAPALTVSDKYVNTHDLDIVVKNKLKKSIIKYINKSTEPFYGGYIWDGSMFHNENDIITKLKMWLTERGLELSANDNIWLIRLLAKKMEADVNILFAIQYYGYGRQWYKYFQPTKNVITKIIKYGRPNGITYLSKETADYRIGDKVFKLNRSLTKILKIKNK